MYIVEKTTRQVTGEVDSKCTLSKQVMGLLVLSGWLDGEDQIMLAKISAQDDKTSAAL